MNRLLIGRLVFVLLILCAPAFAEEHFVGMKQGGFKVRYIAPKNPQFVRIYESFRDSQALDMLVQLFNDKLNIPVVIPITVGECGSAGAFYDPKTRSITLCYEFYKSIEMSFRQGSGLRPGEPLTDDIVLHTFNTVSFVMYHEIAHALIHNLQLATVGREEDAADQLAALSMLQEAVDGASVAASTAISFSFDVEQMSRSGVKAHQLAYWDEHSLNAQRMYDIVCLIYGSNPNKYASLISMKALPVQRAARCPTEYQKKSTAWAHLLAPHLKQTGR